MIIYALIARSFPTEVGAGGSGFILGIGRGGAVAGPVIASFLFASGNVSLLIVSVIMGTGSVIAAIALMLMKRHPETLKQELINN